MPTNDEIKQKHREFRRMYGFADWDKEVDVMLSEARAEGYKEGQADTAKQIFAEIESLRDEQNYEALKKKYNIAESDAEKQK